MGFSGDAANGRNADEGDRYAHGGTWHSGE